MDLAPLYEKYGKEKVDDAVKYLSYKKKISPLPKEESDTKPTLYVFRHGQSTDNVNFLYSGWRDADLTPKGIEQAEALIDKFKDKKIDVLYASDQKRAIKTMKIVMSKNASAKNLKLINDWRLKERNYGDLNGKDKLAAHLESPEELKSYRRGYDKAPPNGESIRMTVERVGEFLDEVIPYLKKNNLNAAISCSSNSIRGIRKKFENLTEEETAALETPLGQDYAAYVLD